jgi:hypothetical protein
MIKKQYKLIGFIFVMVLSADIMAWTYKIQNGLQEPINNLKMVTAGGSVYEQGVLAPGETVVWETSVYCMYSLEWDTVRLGHVYDRPGWSTIPSTGFNVACRDLNITFKYDQNGNIILKA